MDSTQIYQQVQDHYGTASRSDKAEYGHSVAVSFGYSEEELASIPTESNLGLSCGNPLVIASLREVYALRPILLWDILLTRATQGETVIDIGSGAGFDVFLAARKIGSRGRAIGIDMNKVSFSEPDALSTTCAKYSRKCSLAQTRIRRKQGLKTSNSSSPR